tara:strand:- start:6642 stop:7739 length:1098 start_codon:yes stop_codon:yes gene_type:complete
MNVCLIGNNLTSLILAYILSKKNFNVEIYSLKSTKHAFNTRTLGITASNLKYLKKYLNDLTKNTNRIDQIKVLIQNGKINEEILFNQNSTNLFNMIKYDQFIKIIKNKIYRKKNISLKKLQKDLDFIKLISKEKFDLIINCETNNILTRKYLSTGISKNYKNKAFTAIISHNKTKNNRATQIFTKYGPLAYLPLSNKSTSVVFSLEEKIKSNPTHQEIKSIINKFNPYYKKISYSKIENFKLSLKLPKFYFFKNILFFGDNLHSIHPLAGQGFNMTIRDIRKLDEIIDSKINLGLNINKYIYEEFQREAKSQNSAFSLGVDFIYEFFRFNRNFIPKNISEHLFSYVNKNEKLKKFGIKLANNGVL